MNKKFSDAIVLPLPYSRYSYEDFKDAIYKRYGMVHGADSELEAATLHYILQFPTVYVISATSEDKNSKKIEHDVYVGETNSITNRTMQHLYEDPKSRDDWKKLAEAADKKPESVGQYVIGHPHFNKSLTLDVENKLMQYMATVDSVKHLNNRRTNAQGDYYTAEEFDEIFSEIWLELHHQDAELFPAEEIIWDSALFKASPFHQLSAEQLAAEEVILNQIRSIEEEKEQKYPHLLFVKGGAGTGKTVLLSHLFYRVQSDFLRDGKPLSSYILVNHHEQAHVYNQIATKLGLQKKVDQVVKLPTQFLNAFSACKKNGRGDMEKPVGKADVVLIDEAHLLLTQGNQGYSGSNQLVDILKRAKLVIAVFDPRQILQESQQWDAKELSQLLGPGEEIDHSSSFGSDIKFNKINFRGVDVLVGDLQLHQQFRIVASQEVMQWIEDFSSGTAIGPLPQDHSECDPDGNEVRQPYEIKVFDSPVDLYDAIKQKAQEPAGGWNGRGLSRVLATYDWEYTSARKNSEDPHGYWTVQLHRSDDGSWLNNLEEGDSDGYDPLNTSRDRFCLPWNYQLKDAGETKGNQKDTAWAEKPYTIDEVGSTFTIQGFDLNYAGVIIGPSVKYRDGEIVFDPSESSNKLATNRRKGDASDDEQKRRLCNEFNVLLKRGVHGLYLFAVDSELQQHLLRMQDISQNGFKR